LVALCLSGAAAAQAPPPVRDTGARGAIGAPGVVIRYEESRSTGVVYLEESGGMASTIPGPVKATRAAAPAASAAEPARKPEAAAETAPSRPAAAAPGKVSQRRAVPPDGAPGKP
jgi:hypothetical protein